MAVTKIRGNTQIVAATIGNAEVAADAAIATTKLADGADFIQRDGTVAFTANQPMGTHKITGLDTPTDGADAATKAYVDGKASGLDIKDSVRAATTENITLASEQTIDGVSVVADDRVLVKDQTDPEDNGVYVCVDGGAWTRATDADADAEVTAGMFVFVTEGTANADSGWVITTDDPIVVGTTELAFAQFSGAGSITAGDGLTKSGNTLNVGAGDGIDVAADTVSVDLKSAGGLKIDTTELAVEPNDFAGAGLVDDGSDNLAVNVDDSTLEIDTDVVRVKALGIANAHIATAAAIALSKLADGTDGYIIVCDGDGVPTYVALSGDATISNVGALTLASDVIKEADYVVREVPSGTINGSNTAFTLANTPVVGSEMIFLNGVLQEPGAGNDYTISGTAITYLAAPVTGDKLLATYMK